MSNRRKLDAHDGFTIAELLVSLAIISILAGLLLPAISQAREAARRITCLNNLRQQSLAVIQYHDTHRYLPLGSDSLTKKNWAWSAAILPQLSEPGLASQLNHDVAWHDLSNRRPVTSRLPVYRCPSAIHRFPGQMDYGGIMGTSWADLTPGYGPMESFGCGVFIISDERQPGPIGFLDVIDGLSQTAMIVESVDRFEGEAGLWASGKNCLSHNVAQMSKSIPGEIFSRHPDGANVAFADGRVEMLSVMTDTRAIACLCTRNLQDFGEDISSGEEIGSK